VYWSGVAGNHDNLPNAQDNVYKGYVQLYTVDGKLVRNLENSYNVAGHFRKNYEAVGLAKGMYMLRVSAGGAASSKTIIVK
jgi:hypothetical protein